jgi:hypothetical protein
VVVQAEEQLAESPAWKRVLFAIAMATKKQRAKQGVYTVKAQASMSVIIDV